MAFLLQSFLLTKDGFQWAAQEKVHICGHPLAVACSDEELLGGLTSFTGWYCVQAALQSAKWAKMMSFQLPLELSLNLVLPLPLSKPGIAVCRFSKTPIGQGMTAAAFSILLLLLIQPLYDMSNLNKQKEAAAETITQRDHRSVAVEGS